MAGLSGIKVKYFPTDSSDVTQSQASQAQSVLLYKNSHDKKMADFFKAWGQSQVDNGIASGTNGGVYFSSCIIAELLKNSACKKWAAEEKTKAEAREGKANDHSMAVNKDNSGIESNSFDGPEYTYTELQLSEYTEVKFVKEYFPEPIVKEMQDVEHKIVEAHLAGVESGDVKLRLSNGNAASASYQELLKSSQNSFEQQLDVEVKPQVIESFDRNVDIEMKNRDTTIEPIDNPEADGEIVSEFDGIYL